MSERPVTDADIRAVLSAVRRIRERDNDERAKQATAARRWVPNRKMRRKFKTPL